MAIMIPDIKYIKEKFRVQPTPGEMHLLNLLSKLDDTHTVYFEPYININHPDIVILKQGGGVYIIEVKDWNLEAYKYDEKADKHARFGRMYEKSTNCQVKTPFDQVKKYKDELFSLYSPVLYAEKKSTKAVYSTINTGVYFHKATTQTAKGMFDRCTNENDMQYMKIWGYDSQSIVKDIMEKINSHRYFTDAMYYELQALFAPSIQEMEQNEPYYFDANDKQKEYIVSTAGERKKIKGVPGSGKTVVLAHRAVNAFARTQEEVLILCFNITLKNYIRDKISRVSRDNIKRNYHICHIHSFISQMVEKYNLVFKRSENEDPDVVIMRQIKLLMENKHRINYHKYKTILIDEVQDFRYEWLCAVEELFLEPNGEFILFGDEKQNIYSRDIGEDRLPRTKIRGKWSALTETYRMSSEVIGVAEAFQQTFLGQKYELQEIKSRQMNLFEYINTSTQQIQYYENPCISSEHIYAIIEQVRKNGDQLIHRNDVCVVASEVEVLRELEQYLRLEHNISCSTTFETQEQYETVGRRGAETIRRIKKFGFYMNCGVMKLSTIQSFKGWEINTLILLLDKEDMGDELVYTALTRCQCNLIVINIANTKYHDFFQQKIEHKGKVEIHENHNNHKEQPFRNSYNNFEEENEEMEFWKEMSELGVSMAEIYDH